MVEIIDIPAGARVFELESPAFSMTPPRVRHREIIPPDVLRVMESSWNKSQFDCRAVTVSLVEDAYVVEEGLVFTADGRLFRETITQHAAAEIERGHAAVMRAIAWDIPKRPGVSVLCKKRGARNFGHWLMEMLPKAFFARLFSPFSDLSYVVPAVNGPLGAVISESLRLLQICDRSLMPVDETAIRFERLLVVSGLTFHGAFMSPLVLNCIDMLASRIKATGAKKIYITRGNLASRRFTNDDDVRKRASAAGYGLLDPTTLSLREQIATFKGATDIIGVMGAGLTNIAFAPVAARVVDLAPASMPDTFFWFIAGLKGQHYHEVRCRQSGPIVGVAPWDTAMEIEASDLAYMFES